MRLAPHWRGHLLRFEGRAAPASGPGQWLRLLLVFALLEGVLGPRWHLFTALGWPVPAPWLRIASVIVAALAAARFFARAGPAWLGLHPWRDWSPTERSYFVQVAVIATAIFWLVTRGRASSTATAAQAVLLVLASFGWGFYQELLYRGFLQNALAQRFGAVAGVLGSTVVFTFGPLHFYHFGSHPRPASMLAAIFAIGLYFALVYQRSRNLWLPAVFHGLGTAWLLASYRG